MRQGAETMSEDAQHAVVSFLADPKTHGGVPVERIDTHASRVFLAGDRAYKLKRAVRFPYLDYAAPDRRRAACLDELRLNRRTAPGLYLEVRSVVPRGPGLAFGPVDDPAALDWVVVMRRLDAEGLFDRMAERGRLDRGLMEALADAVAGFHAGAEIRRDGGGADAMAWVLDDNAQELAELAPWLGRERIGDFAARSRSALDRTRGLLDRRRDEGFVRYCHGDLHLRNVCLLDGRPTPFDCIEFNDAIAICDVLYDLAFLLMDLDLHGLRPCANAVLNRYLERTEEHAGLALLPLFLSARAGVRAKVAATAGDRGEAERHFRLARSYLDPEPPRLVAVGGLSGSGKTTVARALAPSLGRAPGAVVLRTDVIRKRLAGVAPGVRLPAEAYGAAASRRVYGELARLAGLVLSTGHSAVADAVFAHPEERSAIEAAGRDAQAPFMGVWLEAPVERLVQRVESRTGDASDATSDVVRRQAGYDLGTIAWKRLDAERPVGHLAEEVKALLPDGLGAARCPATPMQRSGKMLRKILLPLSGSPHDAASLRAAFDLARSFEAHVEGLFVRIDPRDAVPLLGEGMSGTAVNDIVRTAEAESMRASRTAGAAFEAARAAAGVPGVERPSGPGSASARWTEHVGRSDELVAREARLADLTVFAQPAVAADIDSTLVLETVLLASGRPLLLVPDVPPAVIGATVAVAWNGSAEASAAVFAAMPFLARASAVHVLTAGTRGVGASAGDGLVEYLGCHGIAARAKQLRPDAEPVGASLVAAAAGLGADLLVMGGYGHSRVREMILGGVTRYVIGHAGIPVLMAH